MKLPRDLGGTELTALSFVLNRVFVGEERIAMTEIDHLAVDNSPLNG